MTMAARNLPGSLLARGQVFRLAPAARDRYLWVRCGRLWVTGVPTEQRGGDIWLDDDALLRIPAHKSALVEATRDTQALLLEPPAPGVEASAGHPDVH